MEILLSDLRFAVRSLLRSPTFTLAALLALGLGIGSAAGVFSLLEGVVLRPLPYREPQRLVTLWETNHEKNLEHEPLSPVNFVDYRALGAVFEDAAAWWRPQLNLVDEVGDPIRVSAVESSENLFKVLGVQPLVGRSFTIHEKLFGRENEAIISHRLWQSRFGGDGAVIGRGVRLNGALYTIVGVMPPGFGFPGETDLWQQLQWDLSQHSRGAHFMESVARLRSGVTPEHANRELAALTTRLGSEFPGTNGAWSSRAVSIDREIAGVFRPGLFALLAASALLLLIACINVANLLLARAMARQREVAVRGALGATRERLVRLFLTESALLAAGGAALGVVVAFVSVKALLAWSPIAIPRADEIGVDGRVLLFATTVAVLTALAFGLVPALLASRTDLQDALKDGSRGSGAKGRTTRSALVVAEIALAVILLSGAGLLIQSVTRLMRVNTGIDGSSVTTTELQLPGVAYRDWKKVDAFYGSLAQAIRARPGITAAGASSFLPLDPGWRIPYSIVGEAPVASGDESTAQFHSVDDGYFETLRVPLVRGRAFTTHDDSASTPVAMVNEAFAQQRWPGENAVGKRIRTTVRDIGPLGRRVVAGDEHEIVGVVRDVKNTSLRSDPEPAVFFSSRQFPFRKMNLVVRGRGDVAQLGALLREEVRRLDPTLPLGEVKPMSRVLSVFVDPPRFVMLLMIVFATLALALAAVGIYGMLSYTVSHRHREFGIRLALGAQPGSVLRLVMRQGLGLALTGCSLGVAGAYVAGRSLSAFLFGVTPWDPPTMAVVLLVVFAVSVTACLAPGRRAAASDPAGALRTE